MHKLSNRLVLSAATAFGFISFADTAAHAQIAEEAVEPTPIVRGFENFPFPVRVPRGLFELDPVGEPYEYTRRLPILGSEAAAKGIVLPNPWGVSGLYVFNEQTTAISDLEVAVSLDEPPPPGTPLRSVPAVSFSDSVSRTEAAQAKLDLWILPFLNLFVTRGQVEGSSDLTVSVDLDQFPVKCVPDPRPTKPREPERPPICIGDNLSGTISWPFDIRVDARTYTVGGVGVYNWGKNVATFNANYTFTDSNKQTSESIIEVASVGAKYGRLITFRNGTTITPYVGINYTHSDNTIRGTATSPDGLLPRGQQLSVRFEARQKSIAYWSGTLGFALGLSKRWNFNVDLTANEYLKRAVFGATFRF